MSYTTIRRPPAVLVLCAVMLLILGALVMRSSGMYVVVLGDEYTYSSLSRLLPFTSSYIPGYLYLGIYRITNFCGDGFLGCARLLNALFFVLSAPFVYAISKRVCSTRISVLISTLTLLAPINSYTIYFMPEPLYFLSFLICIWYLLKLNEQSSLTNWIVIGLLCGASALVKPHAMFIIPGMLCYITYLHIFSSKNWVRASIAKSITFCAALFICKFLISYLLAGKNGLTFLGNFYNSTLKGSTSNTQRYLDIAEATPKIAEGHILALCLLFGVPLVVVIASSISNLRNRNTASASAKLSFLTLILLLNLVAVVALFSASVAGTNAVETAVRLHMRYYDFIFPLLYIAAAAHLDKLEPTHKATWYTAIAAISLATLYTIGTRIAPYTPYMVDAPELRGFTVNDNIFMMLSALSLLSTLAMLRSPQTGAKIFIFIFLPASTIASTLYINKEVSQRLVADAYDKAGLYAKQNLSKEELDHLMILGEDPAGALRTLFYVDNANAIRGFQTLDRPFAASDMADKNILISIGNVSLNPDELVLQRFNGFTLATKPAHTQIAFNSQAWPSAVKSVAGLASPENWGAWSIGREVTITFHNPLPNSFILKLQGHAFGPNQEQPIFVTGADNAASFSLTTQVQTINVVIHNTLKSNHLTLVIPNPTSPKSLNQSVDERALGIGLTSLEIIPHE